MASRAFQVSISSTAAAIVAVVFGSMAKSLDSRKVSIIQSVVFHNLLTYLTHRADHGSPLHDPLINNDNFKSIYFGADIYLNDLYVPARDAWWEP